MKLIPKQIDLEVTSACNLKCRYCPGIGTEAKHMDFDLFKSIIDRVNFETTIVPWLNGEPLMHPRYLDMLKCIEEKKLRYYITTNGTVWKQDIFDYICREDTSCYQLIISLDGLPFSRSVNLARPGTDEHRLYRTIEYVLKNKKKIDLAVKICRRGQDWEEIERYVSHWLSEGVDFVVAGDALIEEGNPHGFRKYPCQYSHNNFMVVKVDGRLVRCAYNTEATNNPEYSFGYVDKTTPLLEIYNNPKITKFRELQAEQIFPGPCATCGMAYTGQGMRGVIKLRNEKLIQDDIYYQRDYYNSFFSLKKNWKTSEYYKPGFSGKINSEV